ncbi:TetR family transcriptional regulator C-terminal domain-containing protein [Leucobacter allii]|uniref:TetR family transcriptional regulator C-terminal domain-containing protein n=1 Tax=Leucobacter allii TaxID=2932247 RepID=A0ABY4FMT4_9MICO|nr:TetR family transcriptional regulator C-terminal domain-containing protein [Leucobacter allii]UOQ57596.1 TetR family transcriptional regulator C-terminal domain-containing protein [Leucobacter allii]UOR02130.1 TetR family transcriptional regulator C-terminal domain-containing protein [Leucobacter allii]
MTIAADHRTDAADIDLATRRRAEILDGAIRVISRDGVVAAKLKDIARESGVSLGLVQHYFDTRENLIDETFGAMMRVISREGAHRVGDEDPLEVVYGMIRLHVYGTVAFPERWGFWSELWAASGRSERIRGLATQIYELWARPLEAALRRLSAEGRLPSGADPRRTATGILALMDGLSIRTLAEPGAFAPEVMLGILTEWVTTQLGVDADTAATAIAASGRDGRLSDPPALTPELIAAALLDTPTA